MTELPPINLGVARRSASRLATIGRKLTQAGFNERMVCAWFGAPLVSDVRHLRGPKRALRRGLGGWIAALVAGESVEAASLGVLDETEVALLIELGWVVLDGPSLTARVSVVPVRGVLVSADRFDERSAKAVGSPDVSAWNLASSLPPQIGSLLDVGAGAGAISLVAARAGAKVIGTDVHGRALEMATLNALFNDLRAVFLEGDLFAGVGERFDVACFNAPLARAELAIAGGAPLYLHAPRGERLILEFLAGARARVTDEGEALCHAQLTPAVSGAAAQAGFARRLEIEFAAAPDGTPHGLISLCAGGPPGYGRIRAPLGAALPHLHREVVDRLHGTRDLLAAGRTALLATTLRPPPWLELVRTMTHDGAIFRQRDVRLGAYRIDPAELTAIEACDGRTVGELAPDDDSRDRFAWLAERGLLVV